jgi:hypothetical protein
MKSAEKGSKILRVKNKQGNEKPDERWYFKKPMKSIYYTLGKRLTEFLFGKMYALQPIEGNCSDDAFEKVHC